MTDKPQMTVLETGRCFKVLQVTGGPGMHMPEHISTKEAVIIVQKGSATLTMNGRDYALKTNACMIIPASQKHTLSIQENFQAHVVMEVGSEIKFTNS